MRGNSAKSSFRLRELRGLGILARGGQIQRRSDKLFWVKSQSRDSQHQVSFLNRAWTCDCEDYLETRKPCKHIFAVNFLLNLPAIILANREAVERKCPYCLSNSAVRNGKRYNKSGATQLFTCNNCNRTFRDELLPNSGAGRAAVAVIALDLHYKKVSLREIASHLWQIYGIELPPSTIHSWITKLVKMLRNATEDLKLEVGDRWLADEMRIKVSGKEKYLWNVLDYQSRKLIASMLADGRGAKEARVVIEEAIARAGKEPKELVTDGLGSYSAALEEVGGGIDHVRNVGISHKENNNRIEAFHGTVRGWTRSSRGMKGRGKQDLEGFSSYYNFVRPHQARGNKPPNQTSSKNCLLSVIRNEPS